jgi:hypothetical protein
MAQRYPVAIHQRRAVRTARPSVQSTTAQTEALDHPLQPRQEDDGSKGMRFAGRSPRAVRPMFSAIKIARVSSIPSVQPAT